MTCRCMRQLCNLIFMHGKRRERGERGGEREREKERERERERERGRREREARPTINTTDEDPQLSNIRIFIDVLSFTRVGFRKHEYSVSISNIESNLSSLSPVYILIDENSQCLHLICCQHNLESVVDLSNGHGELIKLDWQSTKLMLMKVQSIIIANQAGRSSKNC